MLFHFHPVSLSQQHPELFNCFQYIHETPLGHTAAKGWRQASGRAYQAPVSVLLLFLNNLLNDKIPDKGNIVEEGVF